MEYPLADQTKFVDIAFKNPRDKGFFRDLSEGYRLVCPNIFLECKNYREDVSNPEFAQIHASIDRWDRTKNKRKHLAKDDKYVLVLDDSHIKKLIAWKLRGEETEIDNFLEDQLNELL
ncbi:MAG: hypothetical protein HWN68_15695 [Desulfobacterales bacterium]|nr:hypothetical protein [Desulfobacterales bacterium]